MTLRRIRRLPPVLMLCMVLAGCSWLPFSSRSMAPPPPEPDVMERDTYVIGHGDILRVSVWKNPELSVESVPVRPDGKISVPLLNDIQAAGLTPEELKELVTRSLAEFVQNPDVTVVVTQVNSKRVHILGQVARSGAVPLTQDMRVLDAISAAGGFTPFADKGDVKIIRRSGGGEVTYRFDYDAYLKGRAPEANLLLLPGDTIVVSD
jgi:polysaccharide export outer membrane protein